MPSNLLGSRSFTQRRRGRKGEEEAAALGGIPACDPIPDRESGTGILACGFWGPEFCDSVKVKANGKRKFEGAPEPRSASPAASSADPSPASRPSSALAGAWETRCAGRGEAAQGIVVMIGLAALGVDLFEQVSVGIVGVAGGPRFGVGLPDQPPQDFRGDDFRRISEGTVPNSLLLGPGVLQPGRGFSGCRRLCPGPCPRFQKGLSPILCFKLSLFFA